MFPDDYPLLNAPSLLTVILHAADDGPVTLEDCAERVVALFAEAQEVLPVTPADLRHRLRGHLRTLEAALVLEAIPGDAWRLTLRGREALRRHPGGIDRTDLMAYPDFAAQIRASLPGASHDDPREASYEQGYVARSEGQPFTANPYLPNSVDHLSWENGWMQALDDGKRTPPGD
ncbi:MAG: hypothetical protein IT488_07545 [Gammaproteobacteria bacterium]|nr:hypothetical protein [Gammaproteobacteria bacterium]